MSNDKKQPQGQPKSTYGQDSMKGINQLKPKSNSNSNKSNSGK